MGDSVSKVREKGQHQKEVFFMTNYERILVNEMVFTAFNPNFGILAV